jgi:hypothetical protein
MMPSLTEILAETQERRAAGGEYDMYRREDGSVGYDRVQMLDQADMAPVDPNGVIGKPTGEMNVAPPSLIDNARVSLQEGLKTLGLDGGNASKIASSLMKIPNAASAIMELFPTPQSYMKDYAEMTGRPQLTPEQAQAGAELVQGDDDKWYAAWPDGTWQETDWISKGAIIGETNMRTGETELAPGGLVTALGDLPGVTSNVVGLAKGAVEAGGKVLGAGMIRMSRVEGDAIKAAADGDAKLEKMGRDIVRSQKESYPEGDFLPLELKGAKFKRKNKTGEIVFEPKYKKPAYNFHMPPDGYTPETWQAKIAQDIVGDVTAIVERAQNGDEKARYILSQAAWYRDMRVTLRREFGGIGDLFADLLGATSAKTGVEQNWNNSLEILRRFSRGEYDVELAAYENLLKAGASRNPVKLQQMFKAGEFPLITKASGDLFNSNSPAATTALLDMFRDIKAGRSPKTPNFTGNLIGYSDDATIDVWAARYLRNKAGLPYIPPPVEKAVSGKHLTDSTIDDPRIGQEFGFGQKVFAEATGSINTSGAIKNFAPEVGDMVPADLQAVVWFIEKEKWAERGWTSKAGEGGSLAGEARLAGYADPGYVKGLRRQADASFKEPKKRKRETDEEYAARVQEARARYDTAVASAREELGSIDAPLERTVLGTSAARDDRVPSNYMQAELAAEFDDVVRGDSTVEAYKLTNTYGRFKGVDERALDAEFLTRQNFDPTPLTRRLVEMGKKYDQDSVFVSKVLRQPTETSRPGVEIYFKKKQGVDFATKLSDKLREYGIDGFTYITDARQADRVNVQAVASGGQDTAGLIGLRFQYVPEFDAAYSAAKHKEIMAEKQAVFEDILNDLINNEDIAVANLVEYDTKVFMKGDYNAYLERKAGAGRKQVPQQPVRPDGPQPSGSGGAGPVGARPVRDGQRKAPAGKTQQVRGRNASDNGGVDGR